MEDHSRAICATTEKAALLISRDGAPGRKTSQELLQERVLSVRINGELALKMVCTPSSLKELILGHLLSEGKILDSGEVERVCVDEDTFCADVEIRHRGTEKAVTPVEIRACDCGANGILGRAEIENWKRERDAQLFSWKPEDIFELSDAFQELTPIYRKTRGIHSCLLMYQGKIRYCCEDIGRHNALDKVIGHAMLDGLELGNCIVYSSGRIPEDMIAKVIRAGIPVLASKSTPTARAVELARRHRVVLICGARPDSMKVFSCQELWAPPVSAGILAGGNSSRMGTNKVLLDCRGETFLAHILRQCAFLPETILSVRHRGQIGRAAVPLVLDERQDYGPLEGIYQVLKRAENPYVLILAADMQCVEEGFLKRFLAELQPEDACMILRGSRGPEPLCGVYSKSILPVLEEMRDQNLRRPRQLFDRVNTHYVTAKDLGLTEEELAFFVSNINTPEDYQNFLKNHPQGG